MSIKPALKTKQRILPRPAKRETIQESLAAIDKRYGRTLARLAK
jgi:hypothetical protein